MIGMSRLPLELTPFWAWSDREEPVSAYERLRKHAAGVRIVLGLTTNQTWRLEQELIFGTLRDDLYSKTVLSHSPRPGTWLFAEVEHRDLEDASFEEDTLLSLGVRSWF
jgi:hypothetical protein